MWELLTPGYGLLYEHVDMLGGVIRWGGLSGLKCWNNDNLFDWIDFFKINTYLNIFLRKSERETKTANFWETRSCSLWRMLISVNQNAERARSVRKKREDDFWSLQPFLLIDKFFLLNFIRETFSCNLNLFSCAQQILIAWTSCLKLVIPNYIYSGYFCRSNHFEWKNT